MHPKTRIRNKHYLNGVRRERMKKRDFQNFCEELNFQFKKMRLSEPNKRPILDDEIEY